MKKSDSKPYTTPINLIPYGKEEKMELSNEDIDREIKIVELDLRREFLEGNKQDREERKTFANKIFRMLVGFLVGTLLIVVAAGLKKYTGFELSDPILITLLTTTSADIIGIFIFVVKYIFKANICQHCGGIIIKSSDKK
jgi:ABC-type Fe3+-siderophore transport system permease subunit